MSDDADQSGADEVSDFEFTEELPEAKVKQEGVVVDGQIVIDLISMEQSDETVAGKIIASRSLIRRSSPWCLAEARDWQSI